MKDKLISIGWKAEYDFSSMENEDLFLVSNVKKLFLENPKSEIENPVTKKKYKVTKVMSDYLREFHKTITSKFNDFGFKNIKQEEIRYVISVPAIYTDEAKDETLQVLVDSGIIPNKHLPENDIIIIMENEASAIKCIDFMKNQNNSLKEEDKFVVVHAGGGTIGKFFNKKRHKFSRV
jgi:molecular chaperone DnaK (HSP70)